MPSGRQTLLWAGPLSAGRGMRGGGTEQAARRGLPQSEPPRQPTGCAKGAGVFTARVRPEGELQASLHLFRRGCLSAGGSDSVGNPVTQAPPPPLLGAASETGLAHPPWSPSPEAHPQSCKGDICTLALVPGEPSSPCKAVRADAKGRAG